MSNELSTFDELKAAITLFVKPTMNMTVVDFTTEQDAISAGMILKGYLADLEKKRKELTAPLRAQIELINNYAGGIEEPLLKAKAHVGNQIARFETEQEKIRAEERRKVESARIEEQRREQEDRDRIAKEVAEKKRLELEFLEAQHKEAADAFGAQDPEELAKERKKIEEDSERERLTAEAKLDADRAIADAQRRVQHDDINAMGAKGVKKNWKCELLDISKVPNEFLIRTLNEPMVKAAARAGQINIPGVRVWQETSIAFGPHTRVPTQTLENP